MPAPASQEGAPPEPFGAANTHADLPRSFVELVTPVRSGSTAGLPPDARIVPLQAPPEKLDLVKSRIEVTSAQLEG
ncbi:hypothetical protein AB0B30_03910 [Streptomyces narbonensis]|uniref:Uncharacterized protein n=1 Tax=Streptomyces narbonensis TaxID=67333 RepID=A0ABV3C726_9ACTN